MPRVTTLTILISALFLMQFSTSCKMQSKSNTEKQLKALIITGQSSQWHYWQGSTPILKKALEDSKQFSVDVAVSPAPEEDMSSFNPDFSPYDLLVMDYEGDEWNDKMKSEFAEFVSNGGGLIIYHSSDNAFTNWEAFNEMIGLGGWGGRDTSAGDYHYWKDGKAFQDNSEGRSGHHGSQSEFLVNTRASEHPIMKGIPASWLHVQDELYSYMRGPGENMTILATAYSEESTGGSGREEPVLLAIQYGKGRVFHTMLGHVNKNQNNAPQCAGFITTLQRGAEWAATGKVTQKVPKEFPGMDSVMMLVQYDLAEMGR